MKINKEYIKGKIKQTFLYKLLSKHNVWLYFSEENRLYRKYRTRKVSLGELNPDKEILLVRTKYAQGVFSYATVVFNYCLYGEKNAYYIVADQQSWLPNFIGHKGKLDFNLWEVFFEQPFSIDLQSALKSKNVTIQSPLVTPENFLSETFQFNTFDFEKDPKRFGEKFVKYIRLKPSLKKEYDTEYEALFSNRKNVIGIAIRRGIEWLQKTGQNLAIGHQCDSEFSLKIELLKNKLSEYKADAIFVTSDDSSVIEILKEEFGEKLLYINRKRNSFFQFLKKPGFDGKLSNGLYNVFAWTMKSPYTWDPFGLQIKLSPLLDDAFQSKYLIESLKSDIYKYWKNDSTIVHKYYVKSICSALSIKWIEQRKNFPPVYLSTLIESLCSKDLSDCIYKLLTTGYKKSVEYCSVHIGMLSESGSNIFVKHNSIIDEFIEQSLVVDSDIVTKDEIIIDKALDSIYRIINSSVNDYAAKHY